METKSSENYEKKEYDIITDSVYLLLPWYKHCFSPDIDEAAQCAQESLKTDCYCSITGDNSKG